MENTDSHLEARHVKSNCYPVTSWMVDMIMYMPVCRMLDPIKLQPQAILAMDGRVLDPSVLVCAFLKEGSEVQVQYAPGPVTFCSIEPCNIPQPYKQSYSQSLAKDRARRLGLAST